MSAFNIEKLIYDFTNSVAFLGLHANERYLHHKLSMLLQENGFHISVKDIDSKKSLLHPEWPTFKEATDNEFAKYKYIKEDRIYKKANTNGSSGFIDFAIGEYSSPEIAIEITAKRAWSNEEIVFDLIKLLDKDNPFKQVFSINFIFRDKGITKGGHLANLEQRINQLILTVKERGISIDKKRESHLLIYEIADDPTKRFWRSLNCEEFECQQDSAMDGNFRKR
jgi:hypothetical protein